MASICFGIILVVWFSLWACWLGGRSVGQPSKSSGYHVDITIDLRDILTPQFQLCQWANLVLFTIFHCSLSLWYVAGPCWPELSITPGIKNYWTLITIRHYCMMTAAILNMNHRRHGSPTTCLTTIPSLLIGMIDHYQPSLAIINQSWPKSSISAGIINEIGKSDSTFWLY